MHLRAEHLISNLTEKVGRNLDASWPQCVNPGLEVHNNTDRAGTQVVA